MKNSVKERACVAAIAALASVAMLGMPIAANAAGKVVWNFNTWGGKRAFTAGIEKMKALMEADAAGKFKLKINYGDALGNRKQNPENIKSGVFEAGQLCVGYYPGKFPLLSVMELPFLLPRDLAKRAAVERDVLAYGPIDKELADRWNMRYLGPSFLPAYEFMGNKRIVTTADMKGVRMRISGLNAKALRKFGAVPTMVTAPEAYEALRRGTIDSFGFPYSYAFGAYKLYEVSKYVTEGLGMSGFMCLQTVNRDAWNRAPKVIQDNISRYRQAATKAMIAAYHKADKKWIPIFHKKLEVDEIDPSVRAKLAAGSGAIWAQWVKAQEAKGRPGRKVLEFVKASVAKHSQ